LIRAGIKTRRPYGKEQKDRQASTAEKENLETSESDNVSGQTNQPLEQDYKRRIGQFEGEGEPPLMKK
jgi:hypothetical protein